jgi:hypothetical protein
MAGPRDYTDKTLKRLFGLSRNKCAFPSCEKEMSDEHSAKHSNICHIEAANAGGERWNPNMTDVQRADYDNLVLLCPPCHDITNNVQKYTVTVLKHMKKDHEQEMAQRVSGARPLTKRPTLLANVINKISAIDLEQLIENPVINSFSVEDKIKYNQVFENKGIIQEYSGYQGKLNTLYIEFERDGNGRKDSLLRNVKQIYIEAKGKLLKADDSLANIQQHADELFNYVKRRLHELIDDSKNNDDTLPYEDVEFAVTIVMVDAFMRCKMLEEPK